MRGAEMARFGFLLGPEIDGDERQRVAELRALHDAQAHAAATEDRDRIAGPHLRGVERRADARHGAAAQEAGLFRRGLVIDADRAIMRNDGVFAEGRDEAQMMDRRSVLGEEARGVVPHGAGRGGARHFLAQDAAADDAEFAVTA